ncbi:MAG TPA: NUDIX hydrolase [Candidatus Saccharimonadales bacterium]|nr:NUDIX hydrolase [Candidatus Saccharimonadales bacterium]
MSAPGKPTSKVKPWKTLSSTMALDEPWFRIRRDVVELPSGTVLEDFYVWESPPIAVVVPFTVDGKFILCRQYRYAIKQVIYQFPGGAVEKGEKPEAAAKRELREETGHTSSKFVHLSTTSPYAHKITGLEDFFLALDAKPERKPVADENEPIELVYKTPAELKQMMLNNEIALVTSVAAGFLALEKLGLN